VSDDVVEARSSEGWVTSTRRDYVNDADLKEPHTGRRPPPIPQPEAGNHA
jgi:hypothetical protein